jgi:hypothetical protein
MRYIISDLVGAAALIIATYGVLMIGTGVGH